MSLLRDSSSDKDKAVSSEKSGSENLTRFQIQPIRIRPQVLEPAYQRAHYIACQRDITVAEAGS